MAVRIERVTDPAAVRAAGALFDHAPENEATRRFLSEPGHHLLLALDGDQAVGMVTGVEMTHPDKGTEMFLYELGVAEGARNRGIGRALVSGLATVARERGCYGMWVLTGEDNGAAHHAYAAAGGRREQSQAMFSWSFRER
jgi:ribosomal protein S18 acetylase RimI-like enzyme